MSRCSGCGFDLDEVSLDQVDARLADLAAAYRAFLTDHTDAELRTRPAPGVWSPLEYACHTRDVLLAQRERIYLALVEERPSFARMNREERVELARYAEESPAGVADQLDVAFDLVRTALAGRDEAQWARLLLYNYPEPQEHDLGWMARHTVHECVHHLADLSAATPGATGPTGPTAPWRRPT